MKSKIFLFIGLFIGLVFYFFLIRIHPYYAIFFFLLIGRYFGNNNFENNRKIDNRFKRVINIILSLLPIYIAIFAFYYGNWQHSIKFGEFVIVSSWELLLIQIFPLIYAFKNHHSRKLVRQPVKNQQFFSKVILIIGSFLPLIINNYQVFIYNYNRIFEIDSIIQEMLYSFITAAVLEELYFRFFVYNVMKENTGNVLLSQILSSLCFSVWHISLFINMVSHFNVDYVINLIVIFFVGMFATVIYEKTGSILLCIIFHSVNNDFIYRILQLIRSLSFNFN